ncbi:glutaminase [Saccharata proteae CBS 121410]|uniref:Glutaminase n=1 Tax=Saccharata proteae CBS 121410 TaxID=1314787 RepID=A0A9P4HWL2_9PEZI|nr:glutaminase [Saccharata proteae CBS 121410]
MLAILLITLTTVLSVVLSHEHPNPRATTAKFSPIKPPSYPLAVRNPYLSAWLDGTEVQNLPEAQAMFWRGQKLGWSVMAKVDDANYNIFGVADALDGSKNAQFVSAEYTSTRTTFVLAAGNAKITLDFLSPVWPGADDDSLVKQSFPFSYLTVSAEGFNSKKPTVHIYSDIDSTWLGHSAPSFELSRLNSGGHWAWEWNSTHDATFTEANNMAQWGQVLYTTIAEDNIDMTTTFGHRDVVRSAFFKNKKLDATSETFTGFSTDQVITSYIPVTAFAHSVGKVSKKTSVVFGIGNTRQEGVNFVGDAQTYYYHTKYTNTMDAVDAAFNDLDSTRSHCADLDTKIHSKSMDIGGQNYTDITTLSVRQIYGAIDVTVPLSTMNKDDTIAWVKEISSNGDIQTMDIIYPMAPIFYWLEPEYIRLMLRPVVKYLNSGKWPKKFTIHDLGAHGYQNGGYPNAVGHNNGEDEQMPLESTGNLLILAAMYQKASKKTDLATNYETLFKHYAEYLWANGLVPADQLSTNDGAGKLVNQTNLAIKAAVGLAAAGYMYDNATMTAQAKTMASSIATKAYGLANDGSHLTLRYGHDESWSVMFNLYPDALLNLSTFNETSYAKQSAYYLSMRGANAIGLPIDSRGDYGSTNWMMFAGATDPDGAKSAAGQMFINDIHAYLEVTKSGVPFCDRYFVEGGRMGEASPAGHTFRARPVVGGHFAFVARGK